MRLAGQAIIFHQAVTVPAVVGAIFVLASVFILAFTSHRAIRKSATKAELVDEETPLIS